MSEVLEQIYRKIVKESGKEQTDRKKIAITIKKQLRVLFCV